MKKTFKKFDEDNSGFITTDNLQVVLGESFSKQEIKDLMKELARLIGELLDEKPIELDFKAEDEG